MEEQIKKEKNKNVKEIVGKVFFWIGVGICGLLAIIASWLCFDRFILGSKVPSFLGYSTLFVETGSMSGTIEEDDIIIIKKTNDYKIGDIVTFIQEGDKKPTTHRIIGYADDESREIFKTKGDANNPEDEEIIKKDEIIGEYVTRLRVLSLIIGWLTKGGGYIYVVAIILVIGLGSYLIAEFKKRKEEKENDSNSSEEIIDATAEEVESEELKVSEEVESEEPKVSEEVESEEPKVSEEVESEEPKVS